MTYKESSQRAAEIAAETLVKMEELTIAPYPDNYEVWYAYHAGVDAELSRKLSDLLAQIDQFDPESYQSIKRSYLGADSQKLLRSTGDSVDSLIAAALTSIDAASSNARDYGDKLADASDNLETTDLEKVRKVVAKMIVDTKDVMERNAVLETELQSASERIEKLRDNLDDARRASETDGLTGLPNRRAFDLGLEAEIERARADRAPLALLMGDVDHFKSFNDRFGHRVGDEVLKLVGRVLRSFLKGRDKPARYGGEEFCMLLPATEIEGAVAIAEQIRKAIAAKTLKSARTGENYGNVTMSLGCAILRPGDTALSVVDRADAALYLAKTYGRNRVCTEDEVVASRKAV